MKRNYKSLYRWDKPLSWGKAEDPLVILKNEILDAKRTFLVGAFDCRYIHLGFCLTCYMGAITTRGNASLLEVGWPISISSRAPAGRCVKLTAHSQAKIVHDLYISATGIEAAPRPRMRCLRWLKSIETQMLRKKLRNKMSTKKADESQGMVISGQ